MGAPTGKYLRASGLPALVVFLEPHCAGCLAVWRERACGGMVRVEGDCRGNLKTGRVDLREHWDPDRVFCLPTPSRVWLRRRQERPASLAAAAAVVLPVFVRYATHASPRSRRQVRLP